jgi:hypothetical protein
MDVRRYEQSAGPELVARVAQTVAVGIRLIGVRRVRAVVMLIGYVIAVIIDFTLHRR